MRRFFILSTSLVTSFVMLLTALAASPASATALVDGSYLCSTGALTSETTNIYTITTAGSDVTFSSDGTCTGDVVIPEGVTSIGASAFFGAAELISITIPAGVKTVGDYAFYDAVKLTSITIPASVKTIGVGAFVNAKLLDSITFAEGSLLTSIGDQAFVGVAKLTSITIPASVISIGTSAFAFADNLSRIYFLGQAPTVGVNAFFGIQTSATAYITQTANGFGLVGGKWKLLAVMVDGTYECSTGVRTTSETPADTPTYSITAGVVSDGANCVGAVVIPEGVTSIGYGAFFGSAKLTSITIPAGVETVGNYAFARATLLKTVTFAEGSLLESIGDGAFERATSLTSITIPASVKTIGESAFIFATDLTSITIPASVESIGSNAFQGATSLESINFTDTLDDPALLTSIGYGAFFGSAKLTSITIPASVKTIDDYAFFGARSLNSITFAEGSLLKSIGAATFANTSALTSITIPASVISIGTTAFAGAANLSRIYFLGYAPTVGVNAFTFMPMTATAYITPTAAAGFNLDVSSKWNLLAVMVEETFVCSTGEIKASQTPPDTPTYTITAGVVSAGASCVGAVVIPEGVTEIQADAFHDALALTSITIPASATSIGDYAFVNTDKLTSVTFAGTSPSPSLTIGEYAFAGTPLLASITIPERVTSIGVRAFYATALTSVTFSGTSLEPQMTIGERAFEEASSLTSITIPHRVSSIGESAFRNTASLSAITVDVDNEQYTSTDGVLFNKLSQTLIAYPASKTGTSYIIPGSVGSIQDFAFAGATLLTSITVDVNSAQFTSTGGVLFNKLSTTVISYPSGRIGSPYSVPESVTTIGTGAFAGASAITSITIPDGISNIGYAAFYSASALTSITIPASVASIGDFAFWGATALSSIYFLGSAPAADPVGTRAFRNIGASPKAQVKNANVNSFIPLIDGKWNGLTVENVDPPVIQPVVPPVVPPVDPPVIQPVVPPVVVPPAVNTPKVNLAAQAKAADLAARTVKTKQKYSAKSLASKVRVKVVSKKAIVSFTISKASQKVCSKSGSTLKMLKKGKCVVTFTVQEPTPKKGKKPKATKTVKTLIVQ